MPWEKQFDKDEALEKAGEAFWAGGYEGTCMTALLEQMGIQKGSFYATFGSKHQVLLDSLDGYVTRHLSALRELGRASSPRQALVRHLDEVVESACGAGRHLGCYLVNTALELAPRDAEVQALAQRTLAAHESVYASLLSSAKERGEVAADLDPKATARGLLALVLGIRVLSRSGAPAAVIHSAHEQALRLLGEPARAGP